MKRLLAALCMAAIAACASAGGGKMGEVRQQVQVAAQGGKVVVTLTVDNGSAAPIYVARAVYEDDVLFGRAFDITDAATGAPLEYTGPMVKRGPPTAADFLAVKAGKKHSNAIDITRSYAFKPGTHTYQLAFAGNYLGNLANINAASHTAVAPITFTFTK